MTDALDDAARAAVCAVARRQPACIAVPSLDGDPLGAGPYALVVRFEGPDLVCELCGAGAAVLEEFGPRPMGDAQMLSRAVRRAVSGQNRVASMRADDLRGGE